MKKVHIFSILKIFLSEAPALSARKESLVHICELNFINNLELKKHFVSPIC